MKRWLLIAAAALALFVGFAALLFPADAWVRSLVARQTAPGWPAITFERVTLRPAGIRLEDVTIRAAADGPVLVKADWVRLRPSWWALVSRAGGFPWRINAELCGGRAEGLVTAEAGATAIDARWENHDLARCKVLPLGAGALTGHSRGTARLRLVPGAPTEGSGDLELRDAAWQGMGRLALIGAVHADVATVRWQLDDGRIAIEDLDLKGPEVLVTGGGTVELAEPFPASRLDLAVDAQRGPRAPQRIAFLFTLGQPSDQPPPTSRHFDIGGTVAAPQAQMKW